jgi:hypothetical protein
MVKNSRSQPGVRVPLWVREKLTLGMQNVKNHSQKAHLGRIFDLGVYKKDTTLILGKQKHFDLGVHEYIKFEALWLD